MLFPDESFPHRNATKIKPLEWFEKVYNNTGHSRVIKMYDPESRKLGTPFLIKDLNHAKRLFTYQYTFGLTYRRGHDTNISKII